MAQEIGIIRNARRKATDAGACHMYNACRAISRVRDTVILIHGPRGCAQTLSLFTEFFDGFKMQGKAMDHPVRVECSKLDENDVVSGGADRVRRAVTRAERQTGHPCLNVNGMVRGLSIA